MCRPIQALLLMLFSSYALSAPISAQQMLEQADAYRVQDDASMVPSTVTLYESGEIDAVRRYDVYLKEGRDSLVVFRSKVEEGQKMLMLGDNYWLLMPKSRRPIRITPMQKLLGDASIGDVSTLTWSEDYVGALVKTATLEIPNGKHVNSYQLDLTAKTSGASYARIELWLEQESYFPIKANLYLSSGKLAKQAYFERSGSAQAPSVSAMRLFDNIQPEKMTRIEYGLATQKRLDEKYFNPAYLSRNPQLEL